MRSTGTDERTTSHATADCLVVGGGPAGLLLGYLLARGGVRVVVAEKHADFLRDFRGDTIHPSTQELLLQLGLLEEFLELPHTDLDRVSFGWRGVREVTLADLSHLPTARRAVTFMPQGDFLDLLARAAEALPTFELLRETAVDGLIRDGGRVVGAHAVGPSGPVELRAATVVAADGRDSDVRAAAGLLPRRLATAMDVLWFRIPKAPDERRPLLEAGAGMLVAIDRGDYYQVAHVIPAGSWDPERGPGAQESLRAMTERVVAIEPAFSDRVDVLAYEDVKLLRVRLERLRDWAAPGLLCIGDAAHAMSPAGGIGINLAIQDAVATANILGPVLLDGAPTLSDLRRVQRRRARPTALIQRVQQALQGMLLDTDPGRPLPLPVRILDRFPPATWLVGRFIGLGLRPERLEFAASGAQASGSAPTSG